MLMDMKVSASPPLTPPLSAPRLVGLQEEGTEAESVSDYGDAEAVYPFGMDPAWHIAGNEVLYFFISTFNV